jgi:hypothetical protein
MPTGIIKVLQSSVFFLHSRCLEDSDEAFERIPDEALDTKGPLVSA